MTNEDLKAKMREALDRKNTKEKGVHQDAEAKEKAHGSEAVSYTHLTLPTIYSV